MNLNERLARFDTLEALPIMRDPQVPCEALDIVYARRLLPVIGLPDYGNTPINRGAPITGAGGLTMTFAVCPPGQGPALHTHHQTWETFTVLRGRFEIRWGEAGEYATELGEFDVLSVPPGVCRSFRNVATSDSVLQVIVSGGVHDMNDIAWPPEVTRQVAQACGGAVDVFRDIGMKFE